MVKSLGVCIDQGDITRLKLGKKYWLRSFGKDGERYYVSHHHIQSNSAYFAVARGCHFEIVEDEVVEEVQAVLEVKNYEQISLF